MDAASRKVSNILDDYRAASNLVTELEYWKARCKAAENPLIALGDDTAFGEWEAAVDGEADKARYLETLKTEAHGM